jgi:hypothetical protein
MKKLLICALFSISSICLTMENDPKKIQQQVSTTLATLMRVYIRQVAAETTENVHFALLKKLADSSYNFSENLALLLKNKGILELNGTLIFPEVLATALATEAQNTMELEHPELNWNHRANAAVNIFSGTLNAVYEKTKIKFTPLLLQRIRDPKSLLPKEVEQELKDEKILNDEGAVIDPFGIMYAIQNSYPQLRRDLSSQ